MDKYDTEELLEMSRDIEDGMYTLVRYKRENDTFLINFQEAPGRAVELGLSNDELKQLIADLQLFVKK